MTPPTAATRMPSLFHRLRVILASIVVCYCLVVLAVTVGQRHMIYHPPRHRPPVPGGFQEVAVEIDDGSLVAWYRPAQDGGPTVAFFNGNAGSLPGAVEFTEPLARRGFGLFLASYPGYDGNPGRPTEQALYRAGRGALDWLAGQHVMSPIIAGYSLGSGVATQLAAEQRGSALVLFAPFTSLTNVAAARMPFLPVRWLLFDRFDNIAKIADVRVPLLITHGDADTTVPFAEGRQLFDAAPTAARAFYAQHGATHMLSMEPVADSIARLPACCGEAGECGSPRTWG